MNAADLVRRLNQHRMWTNSNLLTSATKLGDEQLQRPFEIGQGSIWKSLLHMYAAEFVWLEALLGNEASHIEGDLPDKIPGNQMGSGKIQSLGELKQKWSTLDQKWVAYLATLTEAALDDTVVRFSAFAKKSFASRRSDVLLHVCMHAHYTAAHVVNMLRHVGAEPLPETMHIAMARKETT